MAGLNTAPSVSAFCADDECVTAVAADLQDALYGNLPLSQLASLLVAVVFTIFFQGHGDQGLLLSWLSYMILVAVFRFWSARRYRVASVLRSYSYWDRLFFVGIVLASLGWGVAGLAFFDTEHVTQQILLVGSLAGISAASIISLAPSVRSASVFLVLSLTPVIYSYLTSSVVGPGLGVLILLYLLVMLFVVRRTHVFLRDNAQLLHGNRRLVAQLTSRTRELEEAKAQDEAEREMAVSVFQAILPHGALAAGNLTYHLSSHSAFNGDLLLIETRPDGRQNLMLGDFTGHGLAASLGAIPAADIFVSMTRKGFPLNVIVSEINRKLHAHLPRNLFCAACLVEIDASRGQVQVWNGGIPSAYLLHGSDGTIRQKIEAEHLPLGILPPVAFDDRLQTLQIDERDQVFMATDGVIEQRNVAGEMFGELRLERILNAVVDIGELSDALQAELARFGEGVDQGDDLTFVALRAECGHSPMASEPDRVGLSAPEVLQESDWSLRLVLQADALRRVNPAPLLNNLIREFNNGSTEMAQLELVLGELYKNALDHGVLGLDSAQKLSAEGFDAYYLRRDAQLAGLQEGSVTIELINHPDSEGGVLEVQVSDTGEGFDHHALEGRAGPEVAAHGRGLPLVRAFCRSLEYLGRGNQARALFRWRSPR